ncbi:hypothetical protein M9458_051648 [Cirrhinus mrigala]|uniref:Uncharacterized protein n=1 Tax=Cirrhinus mrigala TaxID=683832 RepID=A0ABD0MSP3_CIRMR
MSPLLTFVAPKVWAVLYQVIRAHAQLTGLYLVAVHYPEKLRPFGRLQLYAIWKGDDLPGEPHFHKARTILDVRARIKPPFYF